MASTSSPRAFLNSCVSSGKGSLSLSASRAREEPAVDKETGGQRRLCTPAAERIGLPPRKMLARSKSSTAARGLKVRGVRVLIFFKGGQADPGL